MELSLICLGWWSRACWLTVGDTRIVGNDPYLSWLKTVLTFHLKSSMRGSDADQHLQRHAQNTTHHTSKTEGSSWIGFHAKGTNPCLLNYSHNSWLENFVPMETETPKAFHSCDRAEPVKKTDSISRAHDEFCQSNVLERALEKAIIIRDCKCLPKTWCWKMYWTCCTSDSNSVWAKLANPCALNFQGALYWFPTFMGVHCENSKGIQSSLNTLMWQ